MYDDHRGTEIIIAQDAAFLVGLEVGRRTQGCPVDAAPEPNTDKPEGVSEVMIRLVSALWLAKSVADCQIGDVAKVNHYAWFALSDLLKSAAADLDAAHGRYCAESNALHAAAESGGAA